MSQQLKLQVTKTIVGGPNNMDLMFSLFAPSDRPISVTFSTNDGQIIKMLIQGLKREDGSGESWNITGVTLENSPSKQRQTVDFYYSSKNRRGTVKLQS